MLRPKQNPVAFLVCPQKLFVHVKFIFRQRKMKGVFIAGAFWGLFNLASAADFSNPLKPFNGSDPHMTYYDGYYYLMTTTWSDLQITRARTLEGLKDGETKVVWVDSNPSRCCNVWAPELHKVDDKYVVIVCSRMILTSSIINC